MVDMICWFLVGRTVVSFCGELQLEKVARVRLTKLDGLHLSKARRLWSLHVCWADGAETEYVNFSGDVWC